MLRNFMSIWLRYFIIVYRTILLIGKSTVDGMIIAVAGKM